MKPYLVLLSFLALPLRADEILVVNDFAGTSNLLWIDRDTNEVTRERLYVDAPAYDMALGPDGLVYLSLSVIARYDAAGTSAVDILARQEGNDLAFDREGNLFVSDKLSFGDTTAGIIRRDAGGTWTDIDRRSDFFILGLDVPRAGPFANDIIWTARDAGGTHWFFRHRRQPDGSFVTEGPFGPLDRVNSSACFPHTQWHVAARRNGTSWLTADGCTRDVIEFDYDGNRLGVFAHVDEDTITPDPMDLTRPMDDRIRNLHVTEDDHVWVATSGRLYHYAPDGALIARIDYSFRMASALTDATYVPFPEPPPPPVTACSPASIGYWKRQCLTRELGHGVHRGSGGPARAGHLPIGPGLHPTMRDGRLPSLVERVDARMARWDRTGCDALWPTGASGRASHAFQAFAAVVFNVEDRRLGPGCQVRDGRAVRPASEVITEIEGLLDEATALAHDRAWRLSRQVLQVGE